MTKAEVIEFLGKSKRTVAQYVADGKLPAHYVSGPNGREARFMREDVDRLKRDIDTPILRAVSVPNSENGTHQKRDNAFAPVARVLDLAAIAALCRDLEIPAVAVRELQRLSVLDSLAGKRPWLTLDEAVAFSGLSRAYLLRRAREGWAAAVDQSAGGARQQWRFNRDGLSK